MKQGFVFLTSVLFFFVLLSSCGADKTPAPVTTSDTTATFDLTAVKKIIEDKDVEWARAITTNDSVGMLNHYCKDGKIFPPNDEPVVGQAAISSFISMVMKFGIKQYKDETAALYGNAENLIEEGNYTMGDSKGNVLDKGKYIAIWRKEDGNWKIYSNMFNSSLPLPAKK